MFAKLSRKLLSLATAVLLLSCSMLLADASLALDPNYPVLLSPTVISEFPKGTWLENLMIRQSDGNALTTILSAPEVYLISTTGDKEPKLVAQFPGNLGCMGIVELGRNVFYVVTGNWSASSVIATPGSWSVWEIDLRGRTGDDVMCAPTRKVASLLDSGFANGITVLNPVGGTILVGDAYNSVVWSVNVHTGKVAVAINDTTMAPRPEVALGVKLGVNGILNRGDGYLYYDNSDTSSLNRIPVNPLTGTATGPAQTLVQTDASTIFSDDFVIDFAGNAFVTSDAWGQLALYRNVASGSKSNLEIIAGSRSEKNITGFTAAKFGTSQEDLARGSLYVTTNGGPFNYAFSNWTAGGMLIRYDVAQLGIY